MGFECPVCHGEMTYEFATHSFKCKCGYIEQMKPTIEHCFHCGATFNRFIWFDPSGCPECNHSFVD
ncbi:protein of unknown function [Ruminococcaceae bacterium BL-6]|nr:protein of unknown function [Ruminococcaceae bacterium BL-6]